MSDESSPKARKCDRDSLCRVTPPTHQPSPTPVPLLCEAGGVSRDTAIGIGVLVKSICGIIVRNFFILSELEMIRYSRIDLLGRMGN